MQKCLYYKIIFITIVIYSIIYSIRDWVMFLCFLHYVCKIYNNIFEYVHTCDMLLKKKKVTEGYDTRTTLYRNYATALCRYL